jgi:NADH dehydrogenase
VNHLLSADVTMKKLFVTGGTGFIGRHILKKLANNKLYKIYCLTRQSENLFPELRASDNIHFIQTTIFDPKVYAPHLAESDVVMHLAAVTGKANINDYFKVNLEGTRLLVQQGEALGVKRFIFISSIAAKFKSIQNYYYAQSKKQAETAVKQSQLNYTIVRPTIVIGNDSPIWQNLSKMVKGPIPIIFGDGETNIQPIYIEDLVDCLIFIIDNNIFMNQEIDAGGPEIIKFGHFLQKIHQKHYGKTSRIVHIPVRPIIAGLAVLEKYFYSYLPLNIGQLTPFYMDSVIEENVLVSNVRSQMRSVEKMLDIVIDEDKSARSSQQLINECIAFSNYLIQTDPSEYIIKNYCKVQEERLERVNRQRSFFEKMMLYIASTSSYGTKLVDVYTSAFFRKAIFRQKLIVLLALLECSYPFHLILDTSNSERPSIIVLYFMKKIFLFFIYLILACLVLGPVHLAYYFQEKVLNSSN